MDLTQALAQVEGDVNAARAALARATAALAGMRQHMTRMAEARAARWPRELEEAERATEAAGIEAQLGDFADGLA